MLNAMEILESMGQCANRHPLAHSDLALALMQAHADPELHAAILTRDRAKLELLLGVTPSVCCALFPVKEPDEEGEGEDSPSKDDDEISLKSAWPRIATAA